MVSLNMVKILRRAAFESKILRLCDFENANDQGGICRRDPAPPPPRDILQKTVYLEGLPKDATVQWLKVQNSEQGFTDQNDQSVEPWLGTCPRVKC